MTEKISNFWASPSFRTTTGALGRVALRLLLPMLLVAMIGGLSGHHHAFAQDTAAAEAPAPAAADAAADQATATPEKWAADGADTAWMLAASALVLLMTPGLAFFYGGLVRSKNMLNTLLMSFGAMALMGILWLFFGYSIAFGDGGPLNGIFGGFGYAFFNGVGFDAPYGEGTIAHALFAIFQGMFFIITPALISGSLVERVKFSTYLVFIGLWGLLVYAPVCHWVWGGGWISKLGAGVDGTVLDFAGGAVVHVNAGFAALAFALVMGTRKGYGTRPMLPHNLPFCLLGVGLLWFGWFGFNAGSALGATGAALPFVTTQIGAAAAMLTWMIIDLITRKEMTALGAGTGAVAGLVGITPACGFVTPMGAVFVGAITACVCYVMATLRAKGPVDDSLDAFAVHGVGGFTGAILTAIFASSAVGVAGGGLLEGNIARFMNQFLATSVIAVFTFVGALILALILKAVMGLRTDEQAEERGLDLADHGEEAYSTS